MRPRDPQTLRFDRRLIHQHDRDIIFNRVNPVALRTLQTFRILAVFERPLARRTHQNFEQFFGNHDGELYDTAVTARTPLRVHDHASPSLTVLCGLSRRSRRCKI
jgi:hypothetical protein